MYPMVRDVPSRMAQVLPGARLIYLVRNPMDRLISHYMHEWYEGLVGDDLEEVLEKQPRLIAYSRYHYQIEQFLPYFPPERWLVLVFEEFVAEPAAAQRKIYEFLGIDPNFVSPDLSAKNVTATKVRRPGWLRVALKLPGAQQVGRWALPESLRRRLKKTGKKMPKPEVPASLWNRCLDELLPDVKALSDFTGRDLVDLWGLDRK
jgi:hypothetical protein